MSRLARSRSLFLVLPATLVVLVAAAWTTLHSQSTVISACAANNNGAIRLAVGGCNPRNETPISWNEQGTAVETMELAGPIGPVRVVREGTGCGSDTVVDERIFTVTLEPGTYRVTPLVSEVLQVTDATGQSQITLDFNHGITGVRMAVSYWRIMSKAPDQVLALNSSTFVLAEATPVTVRVRAEQRGCGHAEMAGALYFDRITHVPPIAIVS